MEWSYLLNRLVFNWIVVNRCYVYQQRTDPIITVINPEVAEQLLDGWKNQQTVNRQHAIDFKSKVAKLNQLSVNQFKTRFFLHAAAKKRLQRTEDFSQTATNFFKRFLGYLIDPPEKKNHVLFS